MENEEPHTTSASRRLGDSTAVPLQKLRSELYRQVKEG
jgi:hypothetical protein